jgi:hypothetical protein
MTSAEHLQEAQVCRQAASALMLKGHKQAANIALDRERFHLEFARIEATQ